MLTDLGKNDNFFHLILFSIVSTLTLYLCYLNKCKISKIKHILTATLAMFLSAFHINKGLVIELQLLKENKNIY